MSKSTDLLLESVYLETTPRIMNEDCSNQINHTGPMHNFCDFGTLLIDIRSSTFLLLTISTYLFITDIFVGIYIIGDVKYIFGTNPDLNEVEPI